MPPKKSYYRYFYAGISLGVLLICQLIGNWINGNIAQNSTIQISNFLNLTHIRNFGGVFGLAQDMGWLFSLIGFALLFGVSAYLWIGKSVQKYEYICFGFIVGGGASNILDRIIYGSVIDFIDFQHIPYWNYIFNTADVMIHVGIWPMLFLSFYESSKAGAKEN